MLPGNDTQISEFLLLGFSEEPELQPLIFVFFLSMYLITVFGNLLIILAVSSDSHLHTPMYFFLFNLSLVDICFTSTTVPKMLTSILTQNKVITYQGCIIQMYFFLLFAGLDVCLLTVMAYDRFVAICHPLHYMAIMNPRLCGLLVLVETPTIPWVHQALDVPGTHVRQTPKCAGGARPRVRQVLDARCEHVGEDASLSESQL
ncbi:Olfactory receptor 7A5 [Pteropus alecto]|uniref:Olfactory receptor n=1 Tax=Pteropus alecto TaxID=9402 RepID=L5K8T3_PTEAL|nr:Olfactory receptor 7A5 [Pteropus alecto]